MGSFVLVEDVFSCPLLEKFSLYLTVLWKIEETSKCLLTKELFSSAMLIDLAIFFMQDFTVFLTRLLRMCNGDGLPRA